jgi:hypothetical protein
MKNILTLFALLSLTALNAEGPSRFYANRSIQELFPPAFALEKASKEFINTISLTTFSEADKFLAELSNSEELFEKVINYHLLTLEEQVVVLRNVFEVQVRSMNITAPKLIIDLNYQRAAYFEYDLKNATNGIVYINPSLTFNTNKYLSLSLLIHETRHAAQLSLAKNFSNEILGHHYYEAFSAQKDLSGKLGFSDFLTLNNEYEAFLFANYTIHKLFMGTINMVDMGTFASQINERGKVKIDLQNLHDHHADRLTEVFNFLMIDQNKLLQKK